MGLLGGSSTPQATGGAASAPSFPLACELYRSGAFAEAYVIFTPLAVTHTAAAVNLALCHIQAGEWPAALQLLDRALDQIKEPPRRNLPGDATFRALTKLQGAGEDYLCPLPQDAPRLAPEYTREVISRLLVDVCVRCGLWDRVQTIAPPLAAKGYQNAVRALEAARSK